MVPGGISRIGLLFCDVHSSRQLPTSAFVDFVVSLTPIAS